MKGYTIEELKKEFTRLGYVWPKFHLIGVRSAVDKANDFDDLFYLIDDGNSYVYTGTTNPGKHYLQNPMNANGAAVLKPAQYLNTWSLGKHRGVYTAWTQTLPVTVFRDKNKDLKSDEAGVQEKGLFGINVHRASDKWISKLIDSWSAGCQVLNNPEQYKQFIELSQKSGLKSFTYTLLREF